MYNVQKLCYKVVYCALILNKKNLNIFINIAQNALSLRLGWERFKNTSRIKLSQLLYLSVKALALRESRSCPSQAWSSRNPDKSLTYSTKSSWEGAYTVKRAKLWLNQSSGLCSYKYSSYNCQHLHFVK